MKKQVIISNFRNTVSVSEVDAQSKFYGVQLDGLRGFITREKFEKGEFRPRCAEEFTNGNGWSNFSKGTLKELIECLIQKSYDIYEFDEFFELMKWVCRQPD